MVKLKHLSSIINPDRPSSVADLSGLTPISHSPNVIFVVGCPRSGTTALGNVLGAHDALSSADESMFLLTSWLDFDELILRNNRRNAPLLSSYTTPQKALNYYGEFVHHFFNDLIAQKPTARYAIDHTPWNSHIFEFLNLLFPNAHYVHILRDKKSTLKSLENIYKSGALWGQEDTESREALWELMKDNAKAIRLKAPGRYHEINYSDFASNPEQSLELLLSSINLKWQPAMTKAAEYRYAQADQ